MKIIDLLNKIANEEELPEKIYYSDKIWYWDTRENDYVEDYKRLFNYYLDECLISSLNDEIEIIEEDELKTKVMIVDKEGNEKEYLLELGEGLKEGEKIFKADNGNWYVQKLIDEKSEFYKWLDEFKPTIYYSIEEDKKIEKIDLKGYTSCLGNDEEWTSSEDIIIVKINEIIDKLNKE